MLSAIQGRHISIARHSGGQLTFHVHVDIIGDVEDDFDYATA